MAIEVIRHECPSATLSVRALLAQPHNLAGIINSVKLKHSELNLLLLMLDLLGLGVGLLLPLLGTTAKAEH